MSQENFKVGLVGTGGIARAHGQAARDLADVDLCAITDVSPAALERFGEEFAVENRYASIDEMLAAQSLDVAVICTWGVFHAETGIQLARSGRVKAILCEKPFTANAAEAAAFVAAARENGVLLAEAFKFRHHPAHLKMKSLIEAGAIGEVLNVRSTFCTGGNGLGPEARKPADNWRFNKAKGGGSIYDLACYNIHHARFVMEDDPLRVFAVAQPGLEVDDGAFILLEFSRGRTAQISVGFNQGGGQYAEVSGRGGMLRLDKVWNNENQPVALECINPAGNERFEFEPTFQFALQLQHMCHCLASGEAHRIAPEDSIGQMQVLDAVYESMGSGRAVELNGLLRP